MNIEEFKKLIFELYEKTEEYCILDPVSLKREKFVTTDSYDYERKKDSDLVALSLYTKVEIGGVSGGSCWDSSDPQSYSTGKQPKNIEVERLLERLCPDIAYLKVYRMQKSLSTKLKSFVHTEYEYKGNNTQYQVNVLMISDIFTTLQEFDII